MQTNADRVVEVSIAAGPSVGIDLKWWESSAVYLDINEAVTLQDDLRETLEALQRQELAL